MARGPVPVVFKTFQNAEGGADMIRKRITFYGRVQGVGFRYRARYAAEMFSCTGWVRNEWDGTVTMEIQGREDQIDSVILAIERGTYVHIENMRVREMPVDENYFTLWSDGTGIFVWEGDSAKLNWSLEGNVIHLTDRDSDEEIFDVIYTQDGSLAIEAEDGYLVFTRDID